MILYKLYLHINMILYKQFIFIFFLCLLSIPIPVFANHGPSTTGGGASTQSGETLKEGQFTFTLDETYTNYKTYSREEAESRALKSGEFDTLTDAFLSTATLAYGITSEFQLEGSLGWYSGRHFIDAHRGEHSEEGHSGHKRSNILQEDEENHDDHGSEKNLVSSGFGNPEGLSDLTLRAKYRLLKGASGHLSIIGGGVFPIGKDDYRLDNSEELEPSSQPGSGRYSSLGGFAYSRYITPRITLDVSSLYTYRFEKNDFKVGDRVDSGIVLAYRLTQSIDQFPQYSLFCETIHQYIVQDEVEGKKNNNSGGKTLFIIPGLRTLINKEVGLIVAPSIPVYQQLNGEQVNTDFRLMSQLFIRF
jgi:hypothetical protein